MITNRFDLTVPGFFQLPEQRDVLIDFFTGMHYRPWGRLSEYDFQKAWLGLSDKLAGDAGLSDLAALYLVSQLLDPGSAAPEWAAGLLRNHIQLSSVLPDMDWDQLLSGRWTPVTVPMVGELDTLQYFMVGRVRGRTNNDLLPGWACALMDETSLTAIAAAAEAATAIHPLPADAFFFCYPLAVATGIPRLKGDSLGLPIALGFLRVLTGETVSERYMATGAVTPDGRVCKVEGLSEKRAIATRSQWVSLFLYPHDGLPLLADNTIETFPAADLSEAWMAIRCYRPGNAKRLTAFSEMLRDPKAFVGEMERIDAAWVENAAKRGECRRVIDEIVSREALFAEFVDRLFRIINQWDLAAAAIYAGLIPETQLSAISDRMPLSLFKFCTLLLALANHRGDVAGADTWAARGRALLPVALKGDLTACVDFFNHDFVTHHNRYDFDPVLTEALCSLLGFLERRHRDQCEFGCPVEPVLGRLYGTLAQNYAFCGPGYLSDTLRYAQKAMAAFGNAEVPEYRKDALRQHCYRVYAYLDAGDLGHAQIALMRYLQTTDWPGLWSRWEGGGLNAFHHAAVARFLADTGDGESGRDYLEACERHTEVFNTRDHPAQLWLFNLGRIALQVNLNRKAAHYFNQSLACCSAHPDRPTLYVMALLPLSGLWRADAFDTSRHAPVFQQAIATAGRLNPDHFSRFQDAADKAVLAAVWERPGDWFPFSYR